MSTILIQNGQIETIIASMVKEGLKATGLTDVKLNIRRLSDNYFYDFNDNTFKNSGWVEQNHTMVEVGILGQYEYDFNTAGFSDDIYICTANCTNIDNADNIPQVGEIRVGYWVDNLDATISSRATQVTALDIIGITGENTKWSVLSFDTNHNLTSAVITQYTDSTLLTERKKWQLTASYNTNSELVSYQLKEY